MYTKSEKIEQGIIIKDAIQKLLMTKALRYGEILLHFDVSPQSMKNYIASLKYQNLIKHHPDDMDIHICGRRYIAVEGMPIFSDIIKDAMVKRKEGAAAARARRKATTAETKEKDYVTIVSVDDYHTKGSQEKRSAWIGTTFGTMEY